MPAYAKKTARRPLPGPGDGGVGGLRPQRAVVRRDAGLWACEGALRRRGFELIAGADEAGRGACAGPLVIAACVLPDGRRGQVPDLADSKLLTPATRERVYGEVVRRAVAWSVVIVPPGEVDSRGLHVSNIEGMRRAVVALDPRPSYALTDGFPVAGLGVPALAVPKGDAAVACIAAASVLAKVTRDRIMVNLHDRWPQYDFATHKGYVTPGHAAALAEHGPCREHRFSYINVRRLSVLAGRLDPAALAAALREQAEPATEPAADRPGSMSSDPAAEVAGVSDLAVRDDVWVEGVTA